MQIKEINQTVERFGTSQESTFSILASEKAFRILSDGLYSDKVTAIVREICCNAWDAQVAAGITIPFLVQLPNLLEPRFAVRDYGTGLSHDDMVHIYTTYFESSKTNSNAFIGQLGLGSKSPFCYTTSFSTVSYFNGEKRTYTAFINEHGIPSITLMNVEPTTEPNGLEVSLPVQNKDFNEFVNKTRTVLSRFKDKPKVMGVDGFSFNEIRYALRGKSGWGLRAGGSGGAMAVMGNVVYPIGSIEGLTPQEQCVLNAAVDIDFEIGDLEVSASRESLSKRPSTVDNIKARLEPIIKDIQEYVEESVKDASNYWQAKLALQRVHNGPLSTFRAILNMNITWKGRKVSNQPTLLSDDYAVRRVNGGFGRRRKVVNVTEIPLLANIKLAIDDGPTYEAQRIRHALRHGNDLHIVNLNGNTIESFLTFMGMEGETIPLLSEFPRPPRTSNSSGTASERAKAKVLSLEVHDPKPYDEYNWTVDPTFDFKEGGLYVHVAKYLINGYKSPHDYITNYVSNLDLIGVDTSDLEVWGVKGSALSRFHNSDKWELFGAYCDRLAKAALDKKTDLAVDIANEKEYAAFMSNIKGSFVTFLSTFKPKSKNSAFANLLSVYEKAEAEHKKNSDTAAWKKLADQYDREIPIVEPTLVLKDTVETVLSEYPMLKLLIETSAYGNSVLSMHSDAIADYINLIDSTK